MGGCITIKTETHAFRRKAVCLFLMFAAVLFTFSLFRIPVKAAEKEQTSKAIAIVFDNSGTMYQAEAWCRAIYSMEVFVAMADETDEIGIYPMNDMTITEGGSTTYTSESPLVVQGGSDVSEIRNIYTQNSTRDTPIEAITDAYNGLLNMPGEDKWLIVLTDGDVFYENGIELDETNTKARLTEMLTEYNNSVNVLYLGIGIGATTLPDIDGSMISQVFSAPDSNQVLDDLTEMSNIIYGRDEIESSSDTLDFDLSMTELILFVQGEDIDNLKLTDADGNEVGTPVGTSSPRYAEEPGAHMVNDPAATAIDYTGNKADESLSGEIVTYGAIPAGTYTIKYDGTARSKSVYYVPNVSIQLALEDEEGNNVADLDEDELYAGTYRISYGLVDENGDLTDSDLLGDRNFQVSYTIRSKDGEETGDTVTSDENGTVSFELNDGDSLEASVVATYLNGYTVSTDSEKEWPFQIHIAYTPYDLDVSIEADSEYDISEIEEAEPIRVNLTRNGEALTPEEMAAVALTISSSGGLDCSDWETTPDFGNSRFLVTPSIELKDAGEYKITAVAETRDDSGEMIQAQDSVKIELTKPPYNLDVNIEADPEYDISEIEEAEPIRVNLTRNGEALTPEEMAAVDLTVSSSGDLDCSDWETTPDFGNSCFLVTPSVELKDAGEYEITVVAETEDDSEEKIQAQDRVKIKFTKPPYNLGVDMEADSEYVISQMDEAEPIRVNVTRDGEALTPEEMDNITSFTISSEDLDCSDWEIIPETENSRFLVIPRAEMEDAGRYQITAEVTTNDEVGDPVQAQDARRIQLKKHPDWYWLMVTLPFIVLVIIILIIWFSIKVLPRDIRNNGKPEFTVRRKDGARYPHVEYPRRLEKRNRTLKISSDIIDENQQCSITLVLKPVNRRIRASKNRGIKVINVKVSEDVESFNLGGAEYTKVRKKNKGEPDKFEPEISKQNPLILGSVWTCSMDGKFSGKSNFHFSQGIISH